MDLSVGAPLDERPKLVLLGAVGIEFLESAI